MKKLLTLIGTLLVCATSQAALLSIDLNNPTGEYNVGDQIVADIVVSDIDLSFSGTQEIIGSFGMDVIYDTNLLAFDNVAYGSALDNGGFAGEVAGPSFPGAQNIGYLSDFFESSQLFALQNGLSSFSLATITFNVMSSGTGSLALSNVGLFNDINLPLNVANVAEAKFIASDSTAVPTPATLPLLFIAGALLLARRKTS